MTVRYSKCKNISPTVLYSYEIDVFESSFFFFLKTNYRNDLPRDSKYNYIGRTVLPDIQCVCESSFCFFENQPVGFLNQKSFDQGVAAE